MRRFSLNKIVVRLYNGGRNIILPRWCCACNARLPDRRDLLCLDCWDKMPLRLGIMSQRDVEALFWGRFPIVQAWALCVFEPKGVSGTLIHHIKYRHRKDLAYSLGRLMAEQWRTQGLMMDVDLIVPVPLHWRRQWMRGYNQSHEIAKGIAQVMGIPIAAKAVRRRQNNRSQTKLSHDQRWNNVAGLFALASGAKGAQALAGKHVLLVDDVITTGATLAALGSLIAREVPGVRISVAAAARPVF